MPLDSGYSYITIDSFTASTNPTEYLGAHAPKKFVDVVTITATITQHWRVLSSDKLIWMKWMNISKTEKDALVTLYEANYTSYVHTDEYGNSFDVVIVDIPTPRRRTSVDADGFILELLLKVV